MRIFFLFIFLFLPFHLWASDLFVYKDSQNRNKDILGIHPISWTKSLRSLRTGDLIAIKAPDGATEQFLVNTAKTTSLGNFLVQGHTMDKKHRLQFVSGGNQLVIGSFNKDLKEYKIDTIRGELSLIDIDATGSEELPSDHGALRPPSALNSLNIAPQPNRSRLLRSSGTATLDILFYYDDDLPSPTEKIDSVVASANTAFSNSGIDIEIRAVDALSTSIPNDTSAEDILVAMAEEDASYFPSIVDQVTESNADMAHTLLGAKSDSSTCGIAYIATTNGIASGDAFLGVTRWDPAEGGSDSYFCGDYTFAHEIGHNLGSIHSRGDESSQTDGVLESVAFPYSFGYRVDGEFRTIMAYASGLGETREPLFSSSNLTSCGGNQPCGIPIGEIGETDNVKGFNAIRHVAAGMRGDSFHSDSMQVFKLRGTCDDNGHYGYSFVKNNSSFDVPLLAFIELDSDGTEVSETDLREQNKILSPGESSYQGECITEGSSLGETIRSTYWTYEDPVTGDIRDTTSLQWNNNYTVEVNAGNGGEISPSGSVTVSTGDRLSITASPSLSDGYGLAWFDGGSCGGTADGKVFTTDIIVSDCRLAAGFKEVIVHTVTPNARAGGSISPSTPQLVENGERITFLITPDSGYEINRVRGSCSGTLEQSDTTGSYITSPISQNCNVLAEFKEKVIEEPPESPDAGSDYSWTIPATSCKANDPGTSMKLQSRESGLTNTEKVRTISITCPIALPILNAFTDLDNVQFSSVLYVETASNNASEMNCTLHEYRGQSEILTRNIVIPLTLNQITSTSVIESADISHLSSFSLTCQVPAETSISAIDTIATH